MPHILWGIFISRAQRALTPGRSCVDVYHYRHVHPLVLNMCIADRDTESSLKSRWADYEPVLGILTQTYAPARMRQAITSITFAP